MLGMSDQPSDQGSHVADQEPASGDGRDQPPADHPTTPALLTLEEAAAELGITVNAVRQRIKRETLTGVKTDAGWLVDMAATHDRPTTQRPPANQATNHTTTPTDQQPTIDLAPLTDLIERQAQELQRLTETATMWQFRARQLEDQLKQLAAGEPVSQTVPEAPRSPRSDDTGLRGLLDRVRRWVGR